MLAIAFPNYYMYLYHCLKDLGKLTRPLCQKFIGVKVGWNLTIPRDMADAMAYYTAVYCDEDFNKAKAFLKKYVLKHVSKKKAKEFCIEILNTPLPENIIKRVIGVFLEDKITFKELKDLNFLQIDQVYFYNILKDDIDYKELINIINNCK